MVLAFLWIEYEWVKCVDPLLGFGRGRRDGMRLPKPLQNPHSHEGCRTDTLGPRNLPQGLNRALRQLHGASSRRFAAIPEGVGSERDRGGLQLVEKVQGTVVIPKFCFLANTSKVGKRPSFRPVQWPVAGAEGESSGGCFMAARRGRRPSLGTATRVILRLAQEVLR